MGTGESDPTMRDSMETMEGLDARGLKAGAEPSDPPHMAEDAESSRRDLERRIRPMSCEIELDGKVHSGTIQNLSPQGLFVATRFDAELGARVIVRVRCPGGEVWEILATAMRSDDGGQGLISRRGLGLLIEEAPIGFHEFVAELADRGPRRTPATGDETSEDD